MLQTQPVIGHLNKISMFLSQLSLPVKAALEDITFIRHYKKGSFLLQEGDTCRSSFWIQQGIVRKFYTVGDKEISTELLFEGDIAVAMTSYVLQNKSEESIQALEDSIASCTLHQDFEQAKIAYPELLQLDLLLTEYHAIWLEERLRRFHTLDARQRYQLLLKEHPEMIQKVQLTFIASYLGITLETLSRIRTRG
jgi:CRP-like cAMP-binding protein